jgi:hypothetical protein
MPSYIDVIIDKDQDINALLQDGSLFQHYAEQQVAQVPAGLQQQILQIASMPTIQTTHVPSVVSTPVPIQPKPTPKPIAPATMNPSIVPHKQSFQSKVQSTILIFCLAFIESRRSMQMLFMYKMSKNQFNESLLHHQNENQVKSSFIIEFKSPFFLVVEIRFDPKENSFQNAFLKFLAGDKVPSLESLANEPIIRKPKDNVYVGAVNAGIVLSSVGQPTGSMGYQTYMVNDESRIEEIMVIGRPFYDDSKGVKINPLLKNLPTTGTNQTGNFLPQTITLTQNNGLFRNAQTVPNLLNSAVRQNCFTYLL